MKTRIKTWIDSFSYFTQLEKVGIFSLIGLILLLNLLRFAYALLYKPAPIPVYVQVMYSPQKAFSGKQADSTKRAPAGQAAAKTNVVPKSIEINTADSSQWVALYKIGPVMAGRIVAYRKKLGGFYNLEQLTEIYGFHEDLLYDLQDKIYLDKTAVKKLKVNSISWEELRNHPYLKFSLSRQLLAYRQHHGPFKSIKDIQASKALPDSVLQKLAPYLEFSQ